MSTKDTALALHLQYPKTYIAFSRGYSSSHRGVDMAWNSAQGGPHVPVFSPADGTVVSAGYDSSYGNYVQIEHTKGVRTLMAHMANNSLLVKTGQLVKRGQQVGTQGTTGNSTGYHVHYEVRLDGVKVDPVLYTFAYPEQVVNAYTDKEYGIKHYSPVKYVGDPVERNSSVDQLKVITTTLRARVTPSLNGTVLGYVNTGIYNVEDIRQADGYVWYNCGQGFWCANDAKETWCTYMPKTIPHYDITMKKLVEAQKDAMIAWCKSEGVEYEVKEV